MLSKCGLIIFFLFAFPTIESGYVKKIGGTRLNQYISHYETLNYDAQDIHTSHNRAKRSITKDPHVFLKLKAYGKRFHIRLKRDIHTFSDNLVIDSSNGPINVDTSHIYNGEVLGEQNSHVFGSIINGVFEGKIITDSDSFYVENAKHYFPNDTYIEHGFHSVIYNENHVDDNPFHRSKSMLPSKQPLTASSNVDDQTNGEFVDNHEDDGISDMVGGCGISENILQWMDRVQNSAVTEDDENDGKINIELMSQEEQILNNNKSRKRYFYEEIMNPPYNDAELKYAHLKYSKDANTNINNNNNNNNNNNERNSINDDNWQYMSHHERARRAAIRPKEENKNTCSLYIQTDPLIWRHIREGIADHDRGHKSDIDEKTREEILSLIAHHVTAVNYIYRNTKFDGRVEHRNIRFEVQRIKIEDESACRSPNSSQFCSENIDVSNFLNLHSLGNHEYFCLAYVFTYRDFTGGTLGLAWVASASGASGGICEKYKTYTETVGGLYQSTKRSLNTGIITFVNYNSRVPPKVSQLTLAHEIGHNFGSPHDYPQECRPGGVNGNFIMFASATSGDRPNNSKFSSCSIRNISNVLDAIEDSKKRNCFKASQGAFCGNKIVEIGEECDCGFNAEECLDKCCYPRQISETETKLNVTAKGCTRRANTQCSPSQGPCCFSETCSFVPQNYRLKCKEETECSWSSTCNGTTSECPEPKPRDDKTKCNNGTQLCIKGECSGSICLLWNMTECFLTSQLIPKIDKRKLCELACQNGNDTSTCRSTSEFGLQVGLPAEGISLRPGSPCDNFQGYCDVFLKCRAVDAEGPLVRLKNLLFNKQTLLTVAEWVTENWYIVVLIAIGFIILMGMFIKCCAVHTPSSNPKKPPARRISDTLRRPMNTLRRMRHPPGAGGNRGHGPRSIPPPQNERLRSAADGGGSGGGAGGRSGGHSISQPIPATRRPPNTTGGGGGGGGGGGRSGNPSRGHHQGYGESRGQQYYPPKANGQQVNYSRPSNNPELYADAYPDRSTYEHMPPRQQNNKV